LHSIVKQSTFMAGNLARTSFRKVVGAAAAAGYDSITIWPNMWRHALRRDGLTLDSMRRMLEDHKLALTFAEGCTDWIPAAPQGAAGPRNDATRAEYIEVCAALGGAGIVVAHTTGAPLDYERDIAAFARACDEAAAAKVGVALELVGFAAIRDVHAAKRVVEGAGKPNGGYVIDIGHLIRGGGSIDDVRQLPAERIHCVQVNDGPRAAPADLVEEVVFGRRLPGDGELDVPAFLKTLGEMGVRASVGAELYRRSFEQREAVDVMRELLAATPHVLGQAGMEPAAA